MPWQRDTAKSIRDNICENLKLRFEEMQEGVDGYSVTWDLVARAPLPKPTEIQGAAVSILDMAEHKVAEISATRCTLRVGVEFAIRMMLGDEAMTELNRLLLDVQRAMLSDISAGGLSLNIVESSSELDFDGPGDRLVGGIVFWEVQYRHKTADPTKLHGER